jgi:serine protease Do
MLSLLLALALAQNTSSTPAPSEKASLVDELDRAAHTLIEEVGPSVVNIRVEREPEPKPPRSNRGGLGGMDGGVFKYRPDFYICSGTIVDPDGYILTSYFNVEGKFKKIRVTLSNGSEYDAQLKGFDAPMDVALIKIDANNLPVLKYCELKKLQIGQEVYVLGRNPENGVSFGSGVISAFDRFAGRMIQTDADTNYGNAGGPLVDSRGRLIGITCKIHTRYASTYGQNSGVSFASTWDKIAETMPSLKDGAKVSVEKRPFLGISYDNAGPDSPGVVISQVHPNSAAAKAGMKEGDMIVEFGGVKITSSAELIREIGRHKPGEALKVKVVSEGKEKELDLVLGERIVEE